MFYILKRGLRRRIRVHSRILAEVFNCVMRFVTKQNFCILCFCIIYINLLIILRVEKSILIYFRLMAIDEFGFVLFNWKCVLRFPSWKEFYNLYPGTWFFFLVFNHGCSNVQLSYRLSIRKTPIKNSSYVYRNVVLLKTPLKNTAGFHTNN